MVLCMIMKLLCLLRVGDDDSGPDINSDLREGGQARWWGVDVAGVEVEILVERGG